MEETMKNATTEEINEKDAESADAAFEKVAREQFAKVKRQGMLIGAQTMCKAILDKIFSFKTKQGKPTMNDYKRLTKDIQTFCETGLSRKVNADGETEPVEEVSEVETVQN